MVSLYLWLPGHIIWLYKNYLIYICFLGLGLTSNINEVSGVRHNVLGVYSGLDYNIPLVHSSLGWWGYTIRPITP